MDETTRHEVIRSGERIAELVEMALDRDCTSAIRHHPEELNEAYEGWFNSIAEAIRAECCHVYGISHHLEQV
jgi:hypothetical protein